MRTLHKHISLTLRLNFYQFALMKRNASRGAHALTGITFVALVIMFSQLNDGIDSDVLQFFYISHFITTFLNNRRQINDNDLRSNSFC